MYYPADKAEVIKLRDNLTNMNIFLAAEIRRPQTVRTFIKEHLSLFLTDNLGSYNTVPIGPGRAEGGYGCDDYVDDGYVPAALRARLRAKLRRYELPCKPVVTGNHWVLEENVTTLEGAVHHWLIKGQVMPLRIDSFLCETREPARTFFPVHRTR